jgi:hypothetical protein
MPAARPSPTERPDGRGFAIAGVLVVVAIAGIIGWTVGRHDSLDALARHQERFPAPTTVARTTVAPTTAPRAPGPKSGPAAKPTAPPTAAPTTPAPTTLPPTVAPTTTVSGVIVVPGETTVAPPPADPNEIADLVPNLAAFRPYLSTPKQAKTQIDALLKSRRHDVGVPGPASTICAAVRLDQPLAIKSRWERDGRRIASSDLGRREAPGFGECLSNGGKPLENGSYQYIAIDSEGHESAAGGIVLGAARLAQRFTNNGTEAVCAIRIAPSSSRYFEVYVYAAAPIAPGATVAVPVAAVGQDVETVGCKGGTHDALASFSFAPSAAAVQPLEP